MHDQFGPSGELARLIIVCGVSGSGKSSVGRELARRCGLAFLDADDIHSEAARAIMAGGAALEEAQRGPWIEAIRQHLQQRSANGEDLVLAYPGLRYRHREALRDTGFRPIFLFLQGSESMIKARVEKRTGHFMPPELLSSQFAILELPTGEADVFCIDVSVSFEDVIAQALRSLQGFGWNP